MEKITTGYIEYPEDTERIEKQLKVTDYIFELVKTDYGKATASYSFPILKYKEYESEKISKYVKKKAIFLEMDASRDDTNVGIGFLIDMSLEELNALEENIPLDITNHFVEGEGFIQRPGEKNCGELNFPVSSNTEKDMFKSFASITVFKKEQNQFIFKVTHPSECLLAVFTVDFR